jgi:hypothetical protein
VKTPDGLRPIEELAVGDAIFSIDEHTRELVETTVTEIRVVTREVGALTIGSSTLRLTSDHPVYDPVADEYAPAGDWFLGERSTLLFSKDGDVSNQPTNRVESFVGVSDVYDISVEHPLHNFITEGVVVHNKDPGPAECQYKDVTVESGDPCDERGSGHQITCVGDTGRCDAPTVSNWTIELTLAVEATLEGDITNVNCRDGELSGASSDEPNNNFSATLSCSGSALSNFELTFEHDGETHNCVDPDLPNSTFQDGFFEGARPRDIKRVTFLGDVMCDGERAIINGNVDQGFD